MDPKINNIIDIKKNIEKKNARAGLEKLLDQLETPDVVLQEVFLALYIEYEEYDQIGAQEILEKYSQLVSTWENKGYI